MNMIRGLLCLILICMGVGAGAAPGDPVIPNYQSFGEVSSVGLRVIEKALPTLREQRPHWTDYRVDVGEVENEYSAFFWRPEDVITIGFDPVYFPDAAKIPPRKIYRGALVVRLDKKTLNVIEHSTVLH